MPKGTCSVDGCERPNHARYLCRAHYDTARLAGDLPPAYRKRPPQGTCEREDCSGPLKARGLCAKHYNAERVLTNVGCSIPGCSRLVLARGWCRSHYNRWKLHGVPDATPVWSDLTKDTPPGLRLCRTCMEFLPEGLFRIRKERPDKPRSSKCKPCVAQDWRDNRERNLAAKAAYNFGITPERYAELMAGPCHVCGQANNQSGRRLHIDHCHATGKVRGALCHACNTALGLAGDSPARLRELAAYVERHQTLSQAS